MTWREDVMPASQQALFHRLGPVAERFGYYLVGGTALALRMGHRQSIDFDWFAESPVVPPAAIFQELTSAGWAFQTKSASDWLLDGYVDQIRVTFMRYAYPTLEPPEEWTQRGCRVARLIDLACMKLWAIASRGSRKDFIDVHTILNQGYSLSELLRQYRQKFRVQDTAPVLYGLAYFDEAEQQPMPNMLIDTPWAEVKASIQRWTRAVSA